MTPGARSQLRSAVSMTGGLAVTGLAGYGFVALAGHTMSAADAATLASVYLLVNTIGPGLFVALEQETSRAASARRSAGGDLGVVVRRAALLATGMSAGLLLVLAAVSPLLTGRALAGNWDLMGAVLISVPASVTVYLMRGLLGGVQRFSGYAATLAVEGVMRLLPCLALAAGGRPSAAGYAFAFAAGSVFGALAGAPWLRRYPGRHGDHSGSPDSPVEARSDRALRRMAVATALLAGATVLTLLVTNLAPIVVTARLVADPGTAAAFAATFVLVRFPVLLFAPVQAMLLPKMTGAATRGDLAGVRRLLRLALLAVAGIGAVAVVLAFTAGPWAVQVLFGAHVRLPSAVVGALGIGTVGVLVAQVLQPALVALRRHRSATLSWAVGSVVLVGTLALPGDPVTVAVWGQVLGCALVAGGMMISLAGAMRQGRFLLPAGSVDAAGAADEPAVVDRAVVDTLPRALIVVPAWNEEQAVGATVREIRSVLPAADVLVVDDGSTDGTATVAAGAGARVLRLPFNLGVGGAMRAGFRYAVRNGYSVAVQVDADGQHEPADVPRLLAAAHGADVVIGSRFAGHGEYLVHGPRKWAMRLLARVLSRLAGHRLTDVTSGFKAVGGRALPLFAEHYPVEYLGDTVESLVIAIRTGCVLAEVPTRMRVRRGGAPSHGPVKATVYLLRACFALLLALVRRWELTVPDAVLVPAEPAGPLP